MLYQIIELFQNYTGTKLIKKTHRQLKFYADRNKKKIENILTASVTTFLDKVDVGHLQSIARNKVMDVRIRYFVLSHSN